MKKLLAIKRIGLIMIVLTIMVIALLGYITFNQYKASTVAISELLTQKELLKDRKRDLDQSQTSIERLKKEQEEFNKTLFEEQDVPAFLDGISNSAAKAMVHVLEMKTQQFSEVKVPKDLADIDRQLSKLKHVNKNEANENVNDTKLSEKLTLASMPIRIKIDGTFEAIVNFLNSIENYQQLLTVSNVEISSKTNYPQLTCEFNLRIYSLKKLKDIKL